MSGSWFRRAAAPLDEAGRARVWELGSGGDSASPGISSIKLANLVDSFYDEEQHEEKEEREGNVNRGYDSVLEKGRSSVKKKSQSSGDRRGSLEAVLAEARADSLADGIRVEVERAAGMVGAVGDGVKKKVVRRLREKGLDAGLCKSSYEGSKGMQAGYHEYIDVIAGGDTRYILEINIAAEFEIARPTSDYVMLLRSLPAVFIGRPDSLKSVVKVMCAAARESIKKAGMHLPPWRREEYVQAKWFSPYKRKSTASVTVKERKGLVDRGSAVTARALSSAGTGRKFCRVEFGCRELPAGKGKLATAFKGM